MLIFQCRRFTGSLLVFLLVSLMARPSARAGQEMPDTPLSAPPALADLVAEGLANNQELQSQKSNIDALRDAIPAAGALDDPQLGLALLNLPVDTWRFNQEPMTQKQVRISQKLPWFGKLDLKTRKAVLEANIAEARWQAQRLALARRIIAAYYDLALAVRGDQINTQLMELVRQLLQSSESRYASGMGLQQDVLQAQVELSRLVDEQNDLADRRRAQNRKLNALLNRPGFQAVAPVVRMPPPSMHLDAQQLQETALRRNPEIIARGLAIEQAGVSVDLARNDFYPDFNVSLAYGIREDDRLGAERPDFFSAGVNLNIPLYRSRKQTPLLEAAARRRKAAEQSLRDLLLSLPHRIQTVDSAVERLQASHRLYTGTLLLQARQWADSAQSAYEVGKLEFNSMINAQMQVLRLQLQADTYLYRLYQKRAELEELVGVPLAQMEAQRSMDRRTPPNTGRAVKGEVKRSQGFTRRPRPLFN
jgi:outer membrane protein, heavy metal efflux system